MLRAVDLQQVLMLSNSMERVQQAQQQHPDMQQRYFGVQLSEERKLRQEQVKDTEETERARIREKEEEERKRRGEESREEVEEEGEERHEGDLYLAEPEHGRRVDIKV